MESTAKNFDVKEVSAPTKAIHGRANHEAIAKIGATPISRSRKRHGRAGGVFAKMFHFFQFKREEFLAHYHRRSNVESTMMMIKTKFGDCRSEQDGSRGRNEVLAKILCHNICCLISAVHELGIEPVFGLDNSAQQNGNLHNEKA